MEKLLAIFEKIGGLSGEHENSLLQAVARKEFAPKTLLQREGKISDKIYFVERGIARTFYYKDGKDITYWLATENDFVGSMASFFMRLPSNKYVATIEHCILWEFDHIRLEKLFSLNQELERAGRLFACYGLSLMEQRFDDLHFNTAIERYQTLLQKQPAIIQRVPLGMIASYLGITQETLSRIRQQR